MNLAPLHALATVGALVLAPAIANGATSTYHCGMGHYVRSGGTEMVTTAISIRNVDPVYAATVLRLTVRDGDGNVVHDSGALAGTPLPLNTDFPLNVPAGKDIATVPPGGSVYLRSNHIWGNNGLPAGAAGNETGQIMSAAVVVAKEGPKSALSVKATSRMRTRTAGPVPGSFVEAETRATGTDDCIASP